MSKNDGRRRDLLSVGAARIASTVLLVFCAALIGLEFVYEKHPAFGFDGFFAIYPLVGFATVIVAVLIARLLRMMVGRNENYYGERDAQPQDLDGPAPPHD